MKKLLVPITVMLLLVGILGGVALFSGRAHATLAQESQQKVLQELQREELTVSPQDTGPAEDSAPVDEVAEESKVEEQGVDLLAGIQALDAQWLASEAPAGWIHIVAEYWEDNDGSGTLPDGRPLEKEYVNDDWYLLDEQGHVLQGVFIRRDLEGNASQVSVQRDDAWYNLTYHDVMPIPEEALPYNFVWNFGFPRDAARLADSLEKEVTTLDGQSVVLYTLEERYASPMKFPEYNDPVSAIEKRAYYDPQSGKLLASERVMILANGEERMGVSVKLLSWETEVQPPAEVLAHLEASYAGDFKHPSELTGVPSQEVIP